MPIVSLELLHSSVRATGMQKKKMIRCKYRVINHCLFNPLHLWDNKDTDACCNRGFRVLDLGHGRGQTERDTPWRTRPQAQEALRGRETAHLGL